MRLKNYPAYKDNAISKDLHNAWLGTWRRHEYLGLRHEIVSEALCDDVIEYLTPTLEQHKGCTIIDVNPGACLWSSKIHDFLKPRCHILMESNARYFAPFIEPLLEKPGSTYRHTTLPGADDFPAVFSKSYDELFADSKLTRFLPRLPKDESEARKLNPELLFIGNLSRLSPKRLGINHQIEFASAMVNNLVTSSLKNELFHRYGLIRMLLWIPELQRSTAIAARETSKSALRMGLSVGATITEVAGCNPLEQHRKLKGSWMPAFMGLDVTRRVNASMRQLGMRIPAGRQPNAFPPPVDTDVKLRSPLEQSVHSTAELRNDLKEVEARFERMQNWRHKGTSRLESEEQEWALGTLAFPQSWPSAQHYSSITVRRGRVPRIAVNIDMCLRIIQLEANLKYVSEAAGVDVQEVEELEERIRNLERNNWQMMQMRGKQYHEWLAEIVLQQISFFTRSPSMLPVHGRPYEPIKISEDEVWPMGKTTLLDITPASWDLTVEGIANSTESLKTMVELIKLLFARSSRNLPAALEALGSNAAEDLIPMCPTITDTRKGGRLNPERVRVTMLTPEMVIELTKAFIEWPFKPDLTPLLTQYESQDRRTKIGKVQGQSMEDDTDILDSEGDD
ncbi:Hypothetical protein R9X50_00705200 [Acrodontium crateriforme]|uniref:Mitochondrial transcription factor 1 n=1 Tax=Acrodontium crateriforme TaxID=150365 RepID=A0AAQ3MA00_9PEZI|nr:Hypothetical protein R9X50_00705200 [Acrodontium crateriforme]